MVRQALNTTQPLTSSLRPDADVESLPVSVVVCAYTERRWDQICSAVLSVQRQVPSAKQLLLVIDHNQDLAHRARREFSGVTVLENRNSPGLSGARNTGLQAATQPVTVFLDDDAAARPGWLATLVEPYERPETICTGGSVYPRWPDHRPVWLPASFDWVVGCSYAGLPSSVGQIRNPIGANMSMRTAPALNVGGFDSAVGRVRGKPAGCEETELAIRLAADQPGSAVLYVPQAIVDHDVLPERVSLRYFLRRCWNEGLSKATVVQLVGSGRGLERERLHIITVIPREALGDLHRLATGEIAAILRMGVALSGLAFTATGFFMGRMGRICSNVARLANRNR